MSAIRRILVAVLAAALLAVMVPFGSSAEAQVTYWYVSPAGSDTNPGTEPSPFRTIKKGIEAASGNDLVMIAPGTYSLATGEVFPLQPDPAIRLIGTSGAEVTTIRGDGSHRVIELVNPAAGSEIYGLRVTNGAGDGAGLRVTRTSGGVLSLYPRVVSCIFEDNGSAATQYGGAMYFEGDFDTVCEPLVVETMVRSNQAMTGGGICLTSETNARVVDCTIEQNTAEWGGGISLTTTKGASITGCVVSGNTATDSGGGMAFSNSISPGDVVVERTSITGNTAAEEGGGWWCYGQVDARRLAIVGNTAGTFGGGIYCETSGPTLQSSLIANNSAPTGGAVYAGQWGGPLFRDCTVAFNSGASWPGIWVDTTPGVDAYSEVDNSILWGHGGKDVHGAAIVRYSDTQDTNLAGDADVVNEVIHADPRFWAPASRDYRLTIGSPCIDAANPGWHTSEDYYGVLRLQDGDGNGSVLPDMGFHEFVRPTVARIAGVDRYETAAKIALSKFHGVTPNAIIASGQNFPDALSAAGLAGALYAPLLLVRTDSVPQCVYDAMKTLGSTHVWIIGGTPSVSAGVESAIRSKGLTVKRIAGSDRYATAAAVAKETHDIRGPADPPVTAFIARGDVFPDALALSPLSFYLSYEKGGAPILLTRTGTLPSATAAALTGLDVERAFVAGSEAAVSAAVKAQIDARLVANGGTASTRWAGSDRYATARAVAEGAVAQGWADWHYVGIATGLNFPDALGGGVGAGSMHGVVLLTRPDVLPASTDVALKVHRPDIYAIEIFGGPTTVSPAVQNAIRADLGL